jgi:hypothetical protein
LDRGQGSRQRQRHININIHIHWFAYEQEMYLVDDEWMTRGGGCGGGVGAHTIWEKPCAKIRAHKG